ncbi:N-formylglutamate amidohydrolase [Kaistia geumhonensis]|uniref:N-formylglutamate amidohydrolase n=1 Tax=Kaistia geumhonensis TaxID=410839 RepID=A0ABU0MB25_9HYPH|nr:N-formylglutamate amidohydrolase [Kaistia geumhonensis]MCX5481112.1 N-formylglutamate amidohydrolase [Kaistia geumhonensis]MDQ0518172.1 putative N-formylglutamate amidohydrolase [Kaistia geumhonensis]
MARSAIGQTHRKGAEGTPAPLLATDEPLPVEHIAARRDPFVFVCEHASNRMPRALGDLGLPREAFRRHIAYDPGAEALTRGLAARFGGAAVLQAYSRLVIDCNREPTLPDAITPFSEDTEIPGNAGLDGPAREARIAAVWTPFHAALDALFGARLAEGRPTALVTIHSYTPVWRGIARPWHVGIIQTGDRRMADPMLAALGREAGLVVGDDQPYSAKDNVDYTIRRHGRARGIPHVMIEVRNDLLADTAAVAGWTDRLAAALAETAARIGLPAAKD